jgi:hypothetical protein
MNKKHYLILANLFVTIILILAASRSFAATNFTIIPTPGSIFPASVPSGGTVSAYYTITNLTRTARNGYGIVGLPNTVTQNASGMNACANPINLDSNASCILQLDISGRTTSNFALCKGANCSITAEWGCWIAYI